MKVCCVISVFVCSLLVVAADDNDKVEVEILSGQTDDCEKAADGDHLSIQYTGTLADTGKIFDSSLDHGQPFKFQLGKGEVIQGWEQGILGMCVGEKRILTIPPSLAYGDQGVDDVIPPQSTLKFDVELLEIHDGPGDESDDAPSGGPGDSGDIFTEIDADKDHQLSQDEISNFIKDQEKHTDTKTDDDAHNKMVADIFKQEDADKDGYISFDEFSGPKHEEL